MNEKQTKKENSTVCSPNKERTTVAANSSWTIKRQWEYTASQNLYSCKDWGGEKCEKIAFSQDFSSVGEKPLANQEATVSAALSIEKSNTAQISGSLTQNPSMSLDVGSTSEWRRGKNYERNQKRKQREWLWKGLEGLNITNPGDNPQTACNSVSTKRSMESSSTQSRTSEMLRKELRSLRTLIRVRRQPVPTKVDWQSIP